MKDAPEKPGDFDMILQNAEGLKKQIYFDNPSVASNAALYQNMLNQQAMTPLRLQDGGPVSSRLDQAAGNFLKAIQPAA